MKKVWTALLVFAVISVIAALCLGRYPISPGEVFYLILAKLGMVGSLPVAVEEKAIVFWNIRVPRVILSFVVGGGISVAGCIFQALFRNPLAAPDILGVSAGACFGAALAMMVFPHFVLGIHGMAFGVGTFAVFLAFTLASRSPSQSAAVLVLAGIVVAALFQAGLSLLMYLANPYDQLARIVFWIMGSFQVASWEKVQVVVPVLITCILLVVAFGWRLNILSQEDEEALALGVDVKKWRAFYVVISTLLVASSVSAVGTISWLGLIIPHIARFLVGSEQRRLLAVSAFLGGGLMLIMDTCARSLFESEIPISIVTSMIGAPFLAYLVLSRKGGGLGSDRSN